MPRAHTRIHVQPTARGTPLHANGTKGLEEIILSIRHKQPHQWIYVIPGVAMIISQLLGSGLILSVWAACPTWLSRNPVDDSHLSAALQQPWLGPAPLWDFSTALTRGLLVTMPTRGPAA